MSRSGVGGPRLDDHGCDAMHRRHHDVLSIMLDLFYIQINSAPTANVQGGVGSFYVGSVDVA